MPGIVLGVKFQALVFFWVCNMKLCQSPPHMYTASNPPVGKPRSYMQNFTFFYLNSLWLL